MSCSLWRYDPEQCDGDYCCGDCDYCNKEPESKAYQVKTKDGIRYMTAEELERIKDGN